MKLHFDQDWLRRMSELGDDECCLVGPPMTKQDLNNLLEVQDATQIETNCTGRENSTAPDASTETEGDSR